MNHRDIEYNWRATMGNAEAVPADVADYLDLVASLVKDDGFYPTRTACLHTCAIDDPIVMLHHVRNEGLCSTLADHRLYDKAVASVRQHRRQFFCDAEVERRMKQADGACPMCGFEPVFHGEDHRGYRGQMTHCDHNIGHQVKTDDIAAYLRRPATWHGSTWPYGHWQGNKLTLADGSPLLPESRGARCIGCEQMAAYECMENALIQLISAPDLNRFAKTHWSSPVSGYQCKWDTCKGSGVQGVPCDHVYMRVKHAVSKAHDSWHGSTELRLNDAGLKLYIQPVRGPFMAGREVTFGMIVGGDQVHDYPGFREFAHQLFAELGVPDGREAVAA
jgi:hypothetical protein